MDNGTEFGNLSRIKDIVIMKGGSIMFRGKLRMATVIIVVFLAVLFVSGTVYAGEKITIAEFNWSGAIVVTHVMKNVMEDRLGIPVVIKKLSLISAFSAMDKGIVDVSPEIWSPNRDADLKKYVDKKKTVEKTLIYENAPQGWYIPTRVAKEYGISTVEDLKKHTEIFDLTGDGIGDIWGGGFGWITTDVARIQIREFGLDLDTYVVEQWIFLISLKEAMRREKPILFYYWAPEWPFDVYDLTEVKFPPYDPAKWQFFEKDLARSKITCGWQPAKVYVCYSKKLKEKFPKAYQFCKQWYFPIEEVSFLITEFEDVPDNPKKDIKKVAKAWVENHPEIVNDWIKGIE